MPGDEEELPIYPYNKDKPGLVLSDIMRAKGTGGVSSPIPGLSFRQLYDFLSDS